MLNKRVEQVAGSESLIGRVGIVSEIFTDEKGNDHACCTRGGDGEDDFWCPVAMLKVIPDVVNPNACLDRFYDSAFLYLSGDNLEDKEDANQAHQELSAHLELGGKEPSWSPGIKRKFYQWNAAEGHFDFPLDQEWVF